ncbi:Homocysteine S-methyltransferase 1 [Chytridiales sp. JEL 0842]|nr:Homocysteine S-methyltransferase 1 [Chytridiales sp. JEL 0842]
MDITNQQQPRRYRSQPIQGTSSLFLRVAALTTTLTYLLALIIDSYQSLTIPQPYHPVLPFRSHLQARVLADAFLLLGWTQACTVLFVELRAKSSLLAFWFTSCALDLVQVYQWAVVLFGWGIHGPVFASREDIMFLVLFVVRLASSCAVLVVAWNYARKGAVAEPSDEDLESAAATDADGSTAASRQQSKKASSWALAVKNFSKVVPYLWPEGFHLQLTILACFGLLVLGRVVNVMVPLQYKIVIDKLTDSTAKRDNPNQGTVSKWFDENEKNLYAIWTAILTYCFLRYLQGGVGVISTLQGLLWIPIKQYNDLHISVKLLSHLHSLSLQFHVNRKTGEVLRTMDRGTNSIGSLLNTMLFNIVPVFVDIGVAVVWFVVLFDAATGAIVLATMILYIVMTIWITEWRTSFRRDMNTLDSTARARAVDSLLNFETVKYFSAEAYEVSRFKDSIVEFQTTGWKSSASLYMLNVSQNTIITVGLAAGSMLCARRVLEGALSVGDFVMFLAYIVQLYAPLNFFGTYYRMLQQNFVDMEAMFDLLDQNPGVKDVPGAKDIVMYGDGATISFDNVVFGYDSRQMALKGVSFTVPANKTVALVGPSGSGKSTIFRLLFRFYDPTSGRILINNQDISLVTQTSLRKNIGVVPQDTVLFNDTISYNIGYGDLEKSEEERIDAAKRAQIHERILSFPDGYNTQVGERGLRLSGGEKQRVAIARTLLKNPPIILLDEATSALDSTTESLIQRSLTTLTTHRTTLIIAHRLSTVVGADCILVLKDGEIVERGTHDELLQLGEKKGEEGVYYRMWMKQLEDDEDTEEVED